MIEESGLPLKSMETSGVSEYPRMPFIGPSAASLNFALISWAVADFLTVHTRSTIETVGVGTRIARPFNLPLRAGITNPIAFAAPVDVGIMERAAARARRRSLCGRSRIFWSFV